MDDLSKQLLAKIMKSKMPDLSHLKPPTELAVKKMIRNLHSAAKKQ